VKLEIKIVGWKNVGKIVCPLKNNSKKFVG